MIKIVETDMNVLEAARMRIKNIFNNGVKVYLSMSGGKDSIVMADITYNLIREGEIDGSLLTVVFIDEECMYDDVIQIVKDWRKKFLMIGAQFEWYCLEVKHFNCVNKLQDDETFICYDRYAEEHWIQRPPSFAIRSHPLHNPREENYQSFLKKRTKDGLSMVGVRMAESIQRRLFIADNITNKKVSAGNQVFPIYDWKDEDVWYYLYTNGCDIPITYLRMYQVGVAKNQMRICNFFAIDTMKCLVRMSEFDPQLMDRVEKRQPNAYLAAMYFDTALFGRNSRARKKTEAKIEENGAEEVNYQKKLVDYLNDDANFETASQKSMQNKYKGALLGLLRYHPSDKHWKTLYEKCVAGDTKLRNLRALTMQIKSDYNNRALKGE